MTKEVLLYGAPLLAAAVLAALAIRHLLSAGSRRSLPVHSRPILTQAERRFHAVLDAAVRRIGGMSILAQVAMGALMDADRGLSPDARRSVRNRFDRKIIDFVLVDARFEVLLIVELDDSTHDADRDRDRDAITRSAGYATMRVRGRAARDVDAVEADIRRHLAAAGRHP